MIKTSLKILLLLVVLVGIIGVFLPDSVHVERSVVIDAPQATVFVLINGFKNFNRWSPWYARDPNAEFSYEGPEQGVGARMTWASVETDLGSGSQEIVDSKPSELVRTHLDFGQRGTAEATFELRAVDGGTEVTWGFDTEFGWDLMGRYYGLFIDRLVGTDYEQGLEGLKEFAESLPAADWSDLNLQIVTVDPVVMAYSDGVSSWDEAEMAQALGAAYSRVRAFMSAHELEQSGPPVAVTRLATEDMWHFEAGIPLQEGLESQPAGETEVFIRETYGGRVIRAIHVGSHEGLRQTLEKVDAYIAAYDLSKTGNLWHEWVSDRGSTSVDRLITNVCVPIR
ncbi:MAG: SRPBCC family protein [Acidobacteriota bacterium]